MHCPSGRIAAVAALLVALSPSLGRALTAHDLECQSTIAEAARKFVATRHKALVACNNAVAGGDTCNAAQREKQNAKATDRMTRAILSACRNVDLETLGFPGYCFDETFGDFTGGDLTHCIEETHAIYVDFEFAFVEYPNLHGLFGAELRCQRTIGRAAQTFVAKKLRARAHCLDQQLKHTLPASVDCLAEVAPLGPGTGDQKTDNEIRKATNSLRGSLLNACSGVTLENLGFPAFCFDENGGTFTADDLRNCINIDHEFVADLLTRIEYPSTLPSPGATPTPDPTSTDPTPTPTPRPPFCGDGTVDLGETCDPPGASACPGGASCQTDCSCDQPACDDDFRSLTLRVLPEGDFDYGWTGISHNQPVSEDSRLQATLLCDAGTSCEIDEGTPVEAGFLAPIPASAGGVPTCIVNRVRDSVTGTYDCGTGCGARDVPVRADVYLVPDSDHPCPVCVFDDTPNDGVKNGFCDGGRTPGASCDVNGASSRHGETSSDCLPAGASVGELDLDLALTTGTATVTASVDCLSGAFPSGACFCPGQVQPNPCFPDGICPASGVCEEGPIDGVCSNQVYRSCEPGTDTRDCEDIFLGAGTCIVQPRSCFGSTITRTGSCGVASSTNVAVFCMPATRAAAINTVSGLPGPAALSLPVASDGCTCDAGDVP